jgi:hypothetical protein
MTPTPSFKSKHANTTIEGEPALFRAALGLLLFELLHDVSFPHGYTKNPPHHWSGEAGFVHSSFGQASLTRHAVRLFALLILLDEDQMHRSFLHI